MMNFRNTWMVIVVVLMGCQSTSVPVDSLEQALIQKQQSQPKALSKLPGAVHQALQQNTAIAASEIILEEARYDITAKGVDVHDFFAGLMQPTPYNVIVHPNVRGKVNLSVKQVTLTEALELVTDLYEFDVKKRGSVYSILPATIRTETFDVNYLLMKRDGSTQTSITSGGISQFGGGNGGAGGQNGGFNQRGNFGNSSNSGNFGNQNGGLGGNQMMGGGNGTNISTRAETDFWSDLEKTLTTMVGTERGRGVIVSPHAGLVTVRAMPKELREIQRYLALSEETIRRQVVLEARIIEVALSDEYQQGINWQSVLANQGSTAFNLTNTAANFGNSITGRLGGMTSLSFTNADFSGVLSLLSTQGDVQVLSSPRVTAMNNQKAVIKVGNDEYFVTDVSSQSTITASATSTGPDIELTPFFSGIALDVTPQIDARGSVLLHVHPSVIETEEQEKTVTLNQEQFVLPLAQSNIRESDTMIRAQSGEIVVIGGLMQSVTNDSESGLPLLSKVPGLGNLFKNQRKTTSKKELIILIKPTVVREGTWAQEINKSRSQMVDWLEAK